MSFSILAVVVSRISADEFLAPLGKGEPALLLAALAIALFSFVLVALRWHMLAGWLGLALPARVAVRALFVGMFLGQLLPSGVGTDLVRGWQVAGHATQLRRVAASLLADRLVALFAACLILALSTAAAGHPPVVPSAGVFALAALGASAAALLVFVLACSGALGLGARADPLRRLARRAALEGVTPRAGPILRASGIALVVHSATVTIAVLSARAYGIDASPWLWLVVVPYSIIAAAIPVSVNGWGMREGTIIVLAGSMGVPAAQALLVSVTLGALNMLASLPGAVPALRGRAP